MTYLSRWPVRRPCRFLSPSRKSLRVVRDKLFDSLKFNLCTIGLVVSQVLNKGAERATLGVTKTMLPDPKLNGPDNHLREHLDHITELQRLRDVLVEIFSGSFVKRLNLDYAALSVRLLRASTLAFSCSSLAVLRFPMPACRFAHRCISRY